MRQFQYTDPTPDTEWNVRQLLEHMVAGTLLAVHAMSGDGSDPPGDTPA